MYSPLAHYGQQFDRSQQVNELLVAQPLCRPTNPDRSLLELGVRLQDRTLTSLRISLPAGFPADRPALSITSPVRHPWVDGIGRLFFPLLDRWGQPGVRLAAVVADALKGLGGQAAPAPSNAAVAAAAGAGAGGGASGSAAQPPPPPPPPGHQQEHQQVPAAQQQQQQQAGGAAVAGLPGGPSGRLGLTPAGSGSAGPGSPPPRGPIRVPPIPATFAEVSAMSEEQLSQALSDEATYRRLVERIAASLNLWQVADQLRAETRELAAANLARAEEQADIRNQQAIIRSSEYAPAKAAFDDKWARQQAVLRKLSPGVLLARLAEGVRASEAEGDALLAQFSAGEVGLEAFVERYTRAQATYHQRDLKLQAAQQTLPQLGR